MLGLSVSFKELQEISGSPPLHCALPGDELLLGLQAFTSGRTTILIHCIVRCFRSVVIHLGRTPPGTHEL